MNIEIYFNCQTPNYTLSKELRQGESDVVERKQVLESDGLGLHSILTLALSHIFISSSECFYSPSYSSYFIVT